MIASSTIFKVNCCYTDNKLQFLIEKTRHALFLRYVFMPVASIEMSIAAKSQPEDLRMR